MERSAERYFFMEEVSFQSVVPKKSSREAKHRYVSFPKSFSDSRRKQMNFTNEEGLAQQIQMQSVQEELLLSDCLEMGKI